MTIEADTSVVDSGVGPSLSAEEEAFFSSRGESSIPVEAGAGDGTVVPDTAKPADTGKPAPVVKEPQHVPLAALQEERGKRKELATKLQTQETQIAELNGKLAILMGLKKPDGSPVEQPAAAPTAEEDIFGAHKHVAETVQQLQKRLDDEAKAKADNEKRAADQKVFIDAYTADIAKFTSGDAASGLAPTPDFKAAYDFLLQSRAAELQAIGYEGKELHDAIVADEFAIVERARAAGKSPAAMLYGLAKGRGYVAKPDSGKAKPSEGAAKLETIERGQLANKSLNGGGGNPPESDVMTAERLLAMPMEEFEAWTSKNPTKAKAIMGG